MISLVEPDSSVHPNLNNQKTSSLKEGRRRLLVFLSRYIEGVGRSHELSPEQVAILAAIERGEESSEFMLNQAQMASLFGVPPRAVSEKLTAKLRRKGLCRLLTDHERQQLGINDNRTHYLRLTPDGSRALEDYARLMFDLPSKVAEELQGMPEYDLVTQRTREIVESDLALKFREVRKQ
jgi:DNA-binding MarR family transcriptional regulator